MSLHASARQAPSRYPVKADAEKGMVVLFIIRTLVCISGLCFWLSVSASVVSALPRYDLEEKLCYSHFIRDQYPHGLAIPCGLYSRFYDWDSEAHCSITESASLLAGYAALRGDCDALDEVYQLIAPTAMSGIGEQRFLDPCTRLLHYILEPCAKRPRPDGTLACAEGEENRLLEAFGVAAENCPSTVMDYGGFVRYLASGMYGADQHCECATPGSCPTPPRALGCFEGRDSDPDNRDDFLMQTCIWRPGCPETTTTDGESNLSYNNLLGFRYAGHFGDACLPTFYTRVIEETVAVMKASEIKDAQGDPTGLYNVMYDHRRHMFLPEKFDFEGNLAYQKPAYASSCQGCLECPDNCQYRPGNVVDGSLSTRWSSVDSDNQELYLDLGVSTRFNSIRIVWEQAIASEYEIHVADQLPHWSKIEPLNCVRNPIDGIRIEDELRLATDVQARYVRLVCVTREHPLPGWGFSVWEFEVHYNHCISSLNALDLAQRAGEHARLVPDDKLLSMARRTYAFYKSRYDYDRIGNFHDLRDGSKVEAGGRVWLSVWADLVELACLFRDYDFACKVIRERIMPYQVRDITSSLLGAFVYPGGNPGAFDNLEVLSALQAYNKGVEQTTQSLPAVEVMSVAPFGEFGWISGRVTNVNPADYWVAPVIFFPGKGWYSKTHLDDRRVSEINPDGTWNIGAFWAGTDNLATMVEVYLIPKSSYPACYPGGLQGTTCLPVSLQNASVACTRAIRPGQRHIAWSRFDWVVKSNEADNVDPGHDYYSSREDNVWVDDQGRLHLRITCQDDKWYCAEIWLDARPGYGTYRFYVDSPLDALDPNVIFGMFTWSDLCTDHPRHREMDFEFGKLACSEKAQFVIQPWQTPGNMECFNMPECATSTHSMEWTAGRVHFVSVCGHCSDPTQCAVVHQWEVNDSLRVPSTLDERIHINLYLKNGLAPTDGQEAEVVISRFEFEPAPPAKPVVGASNRAAVDPIADIAKNSFLFKLWGVVHSADCDNLWISDGSGADSGELLLVKVYEPFHCLSAGDYIWAQGLLSRQPNGWPRLDASASRMEVVR